ncbi:hypothetical protein KKD42_01885 [Patescibacteria group bacterium]|nr:hypothetical protein [Patescibacteria group bacterium]
MNSPLQTALLKTLAFHHVWRHAPTLPEWINTLEFRTGEVSEETAAQNIFSLVEAGEVLSCEGRFVFPIDGLQLIRQNRENEIWSSRKLRVARQAAAWLARLKAVRFVAVCNATALGHARDAGDIDFFVIVRAGNLMLTRALAALPFQLLGRRPSGNKIRDAICLSYFISDSELDLAPHMLIPEDPYFRYWFLSMVPLYDDGIARQFWEANSAIRRSHPLARKWEAPPDRALPVRRLRLPQIRWLERPARNIQMRAFPQTIKEMMNVDTRVIVNDNVLKFHVEDDRGEFRKRYEDICREKGI